MLNQKFITCAQNKTILKIKVVPNAKKAQIEQYNEEFLKLKIDAPSVDNKANRALVQFLANMFQTPKKNVKIVLGEKSHYKTVEIENVDFQKAHKIILTYLLI